MDFILNAVLVLGGIALIASVILYVCSKKFAVKEDPRLAQVAELLPGANCGGCGFPGCSGLADALVKGADAGSIEGLNCPVGGSDVMKQVADLLGMANRKWLSSGVMVRVTTDLVSPSMMDCKLVRLSMHVVLGRRDVDTDVSDVGIV